MIREGVKYRIVEDSRAVWREPGRYAFLFDVGAKAERGDIVNVAIVLPFQTAEIIEIRERPEKPHTMEAIIEYKDETE